MLVEPDIKRAEHAAYVLHAIAQERRGHESHPRAGHDAFHNVIRGSTTSNNSAPPRFMLPISGNERPSNGRRSRIILAELEMSRRWVVCDDFLRSGSSSTAARSDCPAGVRSAAAGILREPNATAFAAHGVEISELPKPIDNFHQVVSVDPVPLCDLVNRRSSTALSATQTRARRQ